MGGNDRIEAVKLTSEANGAGQAAPAGDDHDTGAMGAAGFADAETREILSMLGGDGGGGSCCGGSCCS